jgi:hypothetical protein
MVSGKVATMMEVIVEAGLGDALLAVHTHEDRARLISRWLRDRPLHDRYVVEQALVAWAIKRYPWHLLTSES